MASRARVILINSLSTYARMFLGFFVGLAITRVALRVIAEDPATAREAFGVFMLLTSLASFGTFFNSSLLETIVRHLTVGLTARDQEQTTRWFSSAWMIYALSGLAVAGLTAVIGPWLLRFFDIPGELLMQARYLIWILASTQAADSITLPWIAALRAQDRFTVDNVRGLITQLLVLACLCAVPSIPLHPLVSLAIAWTLPNAISQAVVAVWVGWGQPSFRVRWGSIHRPYCKAMIHFGGWNGVIAFTSRLYSRTDQILINLLIGPVANTFYAVALQFQGYVSRTLQGFTGVLLPTATRIAVAGAKDEARQLVTRATRYVMTLSLPLVVVVSVYRRQIIEAWLGPGFEQAQDILPLIMLLMLVRSPHIVTWPYLMGADRIKWPAIALLIDGIVNVVLSVVLVVYLDLGLVGIVLGTVTTNILRLNLFQSTYVAQSLQMSLRCYYLSGLTRPVLATLIYAPWLYLAEATNQHPYTQFALGVLLAGAYAFAIVFWIFDDYERKTILGWPQQSPEIPDRSEDLA